MLALDPYPGYQGKYFSMPVRNVVPKPVQKPHPPLWVACSNRETIHLAAQLGIGALTFAFVDPAEAKHWVDDYYETFKRECVPIGHAVNPNIAMVTGFSCHEDGEEARRRGTRRLPLLRLRAGAPLRLRHAPAGPHRHLGQVRGGRAELDLAILGGGTGGIGTPDELRDAPADVRGRTGVDQVIFIQQGGKQPPRAHLRVARAVRGLGDAGVQGARGRARRAQGGGAGARTWRRPSSASARPRALAETDIPTYQAYGLTVTQPVDLENMPEANRRRILTFKRMREIMEGR